MNKQKIRLVIFFIAAINTSLAISHPDTTLAPVIITKGLVLVNYLLMLFSVFFIDYKRIKARNILLLSVVLLWFLYRNLNVAKGENVQLQGGTLLFLTLFSLLSESDMAILMRWYRYFLIVVSVFSLIVLADFVLGLGLPHTMVPFYEEQLGFYIDYKISYIHLESFLRSCGLFNEPGYFGTFLALALVQDGLNLKRVSNLLLLIAGCFTFSLAFFAIVALGALMSIRNMKTFVTVVVSALIIAIVIPYVAERNEQVEAVLERMEFDKDTKKFVGDNRTTGEFELIEESFKNGDNLLFGYGTGYIKSYDLKNISSYKALIVEWGYFGFLLIMGSLIFCGIKESHKKRAAIVYVLCFAASIYQRPGVFTIDYFVLLFGGIQYIRYYSQSVIHKTNRILSYDQV